MENNIEADNELLTKFIFNLTTGEENKLVYEWLGDDKERYEKLDRLLLAVDVPDEIEKKISGDEALKFMQKRISRKKQHLILWRLAAIFVGMIFLVSGIYFVQKASEPQWQTISSLKGEKRSVDLADGTKVLLAPDSKFTYPLSFKKDIREVKLEGEAYFEVKHESKRRFIVHTANADIEVLGTTFNVNAYEDDNNVSTVLVNGKVKLYFKRSDDEKALECLLFPSQKAVYNKKTNAYSIRKVDLRHELAWRDNRLSFNNESLYHALKQIERFYNVDIVISGKLPAKKITGEFEHEPIEEVLETMQEWTTFKYEIKKDKVFIKS